MNVRRFARRLVSSAVDEHLRRRDTLTGLPHRAAFLSDLDRLCDRAASVALAVVDIDGFAGVNEQFGRDRGDSVLREVANRLRRAAGPSAVLGRLGADQFALALAADEQAANALGADLLRAMRVRVAQGDEVHFLTGSVGMALRAETTAEVLLADADAAMRAAKTGGRDRFVLLDEARRAAGLDRRATLSHLRTCLEHRDLLVHYQPVVDLATREVLGFEALVRLPAPDGEGLMFPGAFLPLAEEAGLDVDLGAVVLDMALAALARLLAERGGPPLIMNVNVSARQLIEPGFVSLVTGACGRHAVDPHHLRLELTETLVLTHPDDAVAALEELRSLGVSSALDDFGVAYSSMVHLQQLPVDVLKVDRTFVSGLPDDGDARAIVGLVLGLAEALGLTVTAEGIETESQRAALLDLGCQRGQGDLFGRPAPLEAALQAVRPTPRPADG